MSDVCNITKHTYVYACVHVCMRVCVCVCVCVRVHEHVCVHNSNKEQDKLFLYI